MVERRGATSEITVVELLVVVTMIALLTTMIGYRVKPTLERSAVFNASAIVALDLEQAVSLAARQRRPVRIACDCGFKAYTLSDRGTGAILFRRVLDIPVSMSSDPVDVFPSGLASAPLTVTVGAAPVTRRVTLSTGGFVRIER